MRLLVVEDDRPLAQGLKADLVQAGFAVDIVDNGVDAEFMGNEAPYDSVVLDLGLPERPGLEVLRNWRAKGNKVPVIILTARDAWREKVEGFKAGADDYLAKPFHAEELIARVNALIRRSQARTGGPLSVGGLSLDEDRQSIVTRDGRTIALSGAEFRLLRYFMTHPDKILSKTRLMEHVYDFDSDKESNVLEVFVRRLRLKIGQDRIETRRGQGYLFRGRP
ncbi:MAG TPA: response regulator transcription factor [Candidatus Manganitrophaceae bacterium]|nr:response regulator transcription factor [Candidatus Manganitrophaceae bacterium]